MGGGKGNSSIGTTTIPEYMREVHADWLGNAGEMGVADDPITVSVAALMDSMMTAVSPYNAYAYTDPSTRITAMETALTNYLNERDTIADIRTNWGASLTAVMAQVAGELDTDIATIQTLTATEWEDLEDEAKQQMLLLVTNTHISTVLAFFETWANKYTAVLAQINALIAVGDYEISAADIATMKTAYTGTINETYEKSLAEFFGGMAALNSVNSSAFMIGGAMLMRARDRDLSKFEADLIRDGQKAKIDFQKDRLQYIEALAKISVEIDSKKALVGTELNVKYEDRRVQYQTEALRGMIHMLVAQAQLRWQLTGQNTSSVQQEHLENTKFLADYTAKVIEGKRMAQVLETEYEERELHLDVKDTLWDMTVYQYGGNILSAIGTGGGGYIPDGPSPVGQALGGALSGAAVGAGVGSVVPGIGTAIGAGVGALLGGLGGFLS